MALRASGWGVPPLAHGADQVLRAEVSQEHHPRYVQQRLERAQRRTASYGPLVAVKDSGRKTFLETKAIGAPMAVRYATLLRSFRRFAEDESMPLNEPQQVDEALVTFFDHLFFNGYPREEAMSTFAAWNDSEVRYTKGGDLTLPRARRALQGYTKLAPSATGPPITWPILCLVALTIAGKRTTEALWVALYLVLMFDLYLRPSEGASILGVDVAEPSRTLPHVAVTLPAIKERGRLKRESPMRGTTATSECNRSTIDCPNAWRRVQRQQLES